jgi:hypothetical protein
MYYFRDIRRYKQLDKKDQILSRDSNAVLITIGQCINWGFIPDGKDKTIERLENALALEMVIDNMSFSDLGFKQSDKSSLKMYFWDPLDFTWEEIASSRDDDTLSGMVTKTGTYAIGIVQKISQDTIPPTISQIFPGNTSIKEDTFPIISAKIEDDPNGVGIDYSKGELHVNDNPYIFTIYPDENKILFDYSEIAGNNISGDFEVKIIAYDFNGNSTEEVFSFYYEPTGVKPIPASEISLSAYPNPVGNTLNVEYTLEEPSKIKLEMYDLSGKIVFDSGYSVQNKGHHNKMIALNHLPQGAYRVVLKTEKKYYSLLIVKAE